jgi:hypothetical protein
MGTYVDSKLTQRWTQSFNIKLLKACITILGIYMKR